MYKEFDFYDKTNLKSYNLNESMRYQLNTLSNLDVFTLRHSENVANMTVKICKNLRLNKKFTIYCTMCAYLHDIGKIFIPSEILQEKWETYRRGIRKNENTHYNRLQNVYG